MEWQPISTAPKDGTWILLTGGEFVKYDWNGDTEPDVVSGQYTNKLNGGLDCHWRWQFAWLDGGFYGEYMNPTHWMPLPEPPKG